MRRFPLPLIALLLIAAASGPAMADQILSTLFAARYCELRSIGVSQDDAMMTAMSESTVSGTVPMGKLNGEAMRSDIILSIFAIQKRCPQWMPR